MVDFELINGQHYPIFTFTTLDGRTYDRIRNLPKESSIKETSIEDVYIDSGVEEFLHRQLPINDIAIKYTNIRNLNRVLEYSRTLFIINLSSIPLIVY